MKSSPTPVLLDLHDPQHMDLPVILNGAGWDTIDTEWSALDAATAVLITDAPANGFESTLLHECTAGVVQVLRLVARSSPQRNPSPLPITEVPADIGAAELLRTVSLLARLAETNQRQHQASQECQRWNDLAMTDALTSIPNRRSWDATLPVRLAAKQPFSAAMIDVDHFKQVNDVRGHDVGDQVLRCVALVMQRSVREYDFVARLGGDEFGMLLQHVNLPVAQRIIDRLRQAIRTRLAAERLPAPSVSAGVVVFSACSAEHTVTSSAVLAAASQSLQTAKRRQRDCTVAIRYGDSLASNVD